jgi:hypothetical protein
VDRGYLQDISEVSPGFQWLATVLIRVISLSTGGKTECLQSYPEWLSKFLDWLYDETQPGTSERKKCIGTFELISTYSKWSRVRCLLSAYMIAQVRLLTDAYEESRFVYEDALDKLGKGLRLAKSNVSEMQSAVAVLRDAPGWTGQRAMKWVHRTHEVLALLDRIEATYSKKSRSGEMLRPIERLLISIAWVERDQKKVPMAIVGWMRAAQAASGKHPPTLEALYKVAIRPKDKGEVANLTSDNHQLS